MAGFIALVGGDEFRPGCEEMDRAILDATRHKRPRLLIVPTAAAFQDPVRAADNGIGYFSQLGADTSALMVLESKHANDETLLSPVDDADVIYVTGGDPIHLLKTLKNSLLLRKMKLILERGAVLAGSSAGAMVLGSWMRFGGWIEALGIAVGTATLPHHEGSDSEVLSRELATYPPRNVTILGIDSKTCCFGSQYGWRALGKGSVTVYEDGSWRRFVKGDTVTQNFKWP